MPDKWAKHITKHKSHPLAGWAKDSIPRNSISTSSKSSSSSTASTLFRKQTRDGTPTCKDGCPKEVQAHTFITFRHWSMTNPELVLSKLLTNTSNLSAKQPGDVHKVVFEILYVAIQNIYLYIFPNGTQSSLSNPLPYDGVLRLERAIYVQCMLLNGKRKLVASNRTLYSCIHLKSKPGEQEGCALWSGALVHLVLTQPEYLHPFEQHL